MLARIIQDRLGWVSIRLFYTFSRQIVNFCKTFTQNPKVFQKNAVNNNKTIKYLEELWQFKIHLALAMR